MTQNTLNDAMPARALTARWVIVGTLTLETALHLGGDGTDRVDMPVLRDPRGGGPLMPGTTIAGALRGALTDRLAGYGRPEPPAVCTVFGGARGDDDGSQSPVIVFDALGALPDGQGIEVRDGVSISSASGTAEDHKKYDYEVLPAGTTFPLRIDLLVPAGATGQGRPPCDEKLLLEALAAAIDAFEHGQGGLGARRSRGLGRVRVAWAASRFDLSSRDGWLEWALSDHDLRCGAVIEGACICDVFEEAAPPTLKPLSLPGDVRKRIVADLDVRMVHDILVRSPGADPGAADVAHLRSGGAAILPGTSLAGAMRAHALRIARLVRKEQNDASSWVDRLFGPRFEGQRPSGSVEHRVSRLRVTEVQLQGSRPRRQSRIAIDRFTQGVVDGALFDEDTEEGGTAKLRLELRNAEEEELGLVLLVLKDLLSGALPVGGASSVGRGYLEGTATITWYEGAHDALRSAVLTPGAQPAGGAASEIDRAIRAFYDAAVRDDTPPAGSAA